MKDAKTTPGFGQYANSAARQLSLVVEHYWEAAKAQLRLHRQLTELADQWEADTAFLSSVTQMVAHPAYRSIVNYGEAAIPFLLERLSADDPELWSPALEEITGVCPIPAEHAGRLARIAEDWLLWGQENGYWR